MVKISNFILVIAALCLVGSVAAHEVYVLSSGEIQSDIGIRGVNIFQTLKDPTSLNNFLTGSILAALGVILLSYIIHTKISYELDKKFITLRKYAHLVIRIGLGISFSWGALHNNIFGPEIPLSLISGGYFWRPILFIVGLMLIFGFFTRIAALICFVTYAIVTTQLGTYMFNYINYFGLIVVLIIERGELFSVDRRMHWPSHIFHHRIPELISKLEKWGEEHSFLIIRLTYGAAIIYTAIAIRILHPALSLDLLYKYGLDAKISLAALFFVFILSIIEIAIGLSLITGIMYRPMLILSILFFGYSIWFFREDIWPNIILIATSAGLFLHGKDKWCLEDWFYGLFWKWTERFRKSSNPISPK